MDLGSFTSFLNIFRLSIDLKYRQQKKNKHFPRNCMCFILKTVRRKCLPIFWLTSLLSLRGVKSAGGLVCKRWEGNKNLQRQSAGGGVERDGRGVHTWKGEANLEFRFRKRKKGLGLNKKYQVLLNGSGETCQICDFFKRRGELRFPPINYCQLENRTAHSRRGSWRTSGGGDGERRRLNFWGILCYLVYLLVSLTFKPVYFLWWLICHFNH